jgi:hypothetical protein
MIEAVSSSETSVNNYRLHVATSEKTASFIFVVVETSNQNKFVRDKLFEIRFDLFSMLIEASFSRFQNSHLIINGDENRFGCLTNSWYRNRDGMIRYAWYAAKLITSR